MTTLTATKNYTDGSTETVTVSAEYKSEYVNRGFKFNEDKFNFASKEEENNAWMERFGD